MRWKLLMVSISILALSLSAAAQQKLPEDRTAALELKIAELEYRVAVLEAELEVYSHHELRCKACRERGRYIDRQSWRCGLQWGMSRYQVRELLGEPDRIDVLRAMGECWHYGYPPGGMVWFSPVGEVTSWFEP